MAITFIPSTNIEIYVFSNNTDWIKYEQIQSDIFDHLVASVKQFDLVLIFKISQEIL